MKKLETSSMSSYISEVKIYLDDAEFILSEFKNLELVIEIKDDDNIYDSLDELILVKGINPESFEIKGKIDRDKFEHNNYGSIGVNISENRASVYAFYDDKLMKIGYEIGNYLENRKRKKIYTMFNSRMAKFNIYASIILLLLFFLCSYFFKPFSPGFHLSFVYSIVFWFIVLLISEFNPDSNTKIQLDRKHNAGFYEKNKEKIILAFVSTLFGALVTFLINYFKLSTR